ncbi:hypothetical protein F4677DRAFT_173003 [Hypoxylon crocopeplum]|nr:hypothetical protein F4677DRAFT_173003 [Hypoxylon crocopeplum]
MDSPVGARGRGRKRHTLPAAPSSQSSHHSSEFGEQRTSATPAATMAPLPFTYETPSPIGSRETRMRTRQGDGINASPEDPGSKGGRSLRKRPRVDYTFDQLDDIENYNTKATPSATRALKRRKTDFNSPNENEMDEESEARDKRRASEQPQSTSSRRRNTTRKSTVEPQVYVPEQQMDDVETQDTIEVGGHHSEVSDESLLRRTSSGASSNDSKALPPDTPLDPPDASQPSQPAPTLQFSQDYQLPQSSLPDTSQPIAEPTIEAEVEEAEPQELEGAATAPKEGPPEMDDEVELDLLEYLTPYIEGSYVYFPVYPEDEPEDEADADAEGDAEADPEVNGEADADGEPNDETHLKVDVELGPDAVNEDGVEAEIAADAAGEDEEAAADDQADGPAENTPEDTAANSVSGEPNIADAPPEVKKQYRFKQTREASEFTDLFTDIKSLSREELYRRLEVTNKALVAWQVEFNKLRRRTDDDDNAVRYAREEAAFQRRYDLSIAKDPTIIPLQKDFVPKGIRAPNTMDHTEQYTRQQDKIMAQAYGFEYDQRSDRVGRQNPIAQRTGVGRQGRLRERPKQTAKAAEAEEPAVMPAKRTRKAPERYNGGEAVSRGSTPAPTQRRGRRGAQAQDNADQNQAPAASQNTVEQNPVPEPAEPEVPKKKGKGGRPRKNPIPEAAPIVESAPAAEPEPIAEPSPQPEPEPKPRGPGLVRTYKYRKAQPQVEPTPQPIAEPEPEPQPSPKRKAEPDAAEEPATRKRRRRGPAPASAPKTIANAEEGDNLPNGTEPQAPAKPGPRRKNSRKIENPSGSFNTTTSIATSNQGDQSRPPTSSSTATAATAATTATTETVASTSNYQLREKRQRKFTNEANDDDFIEAPKPKRTRRTAPKKTQVEDEAVMHAPEPPIPMQQPEPEAPPPPKQIKIKLKPGTDPRQQHPNSTPVPSEPSLVPPANLNPPVNSNPPPISDNVNGDSNGSAASNGIVQPSPADVAEFIKDYNAMTKSEKMSASMKARWASGSMGNAVEKRRATLAAKKQSAKPPGAANAPTPEQAPTPTGDEVTAGQ